MIIGIDASRANETKKTGTEWYAYHVIEEFKKIADPRDQFILYSKEPLVGNLGILPTNFKSKILRWPPKLLWTQLRLAWEMLTHPPDVLFVPAHTIPIIHPKRTITTLHDVGFERYQALYSQKTIGPQRPILRKLLWLAVKIISLGRYGTNELDYHRWSARLALRGASKIITVSRFSRHEIIDIFHTHADKINVIYNAPDPAYQKIQNRAVIQRVLKEYSLSKPYFLYIGRLEEKKNTERLIKGFATYKRLLPNTTKLVLVGKPGYGYEKIKTTIENLGVASDIIELGWIINDALPALMNAAEAFVFPSAYEGFGIPIIEAMRCGTPVITSNWGAMREVAADAALLVDSQDPEKIALALQQITTDQALRRSLVQKGFKRVADFSWKRCSAETLRVITSV